MHERDSTVFYAFKTITHALIINFQCVLHTLHVHTYVYLLLIYYQSKKKKNEIIKNSKYLCRITINTNILTPHLAKHVYVCVCVCINTFLIFIS